MPIVDLTKVEVRAARLSESFYVLERQGGTISVLTGPDGVLMVDSQLAPLTEKIMASVRQFSDQPLRFLTLTTETHRSPWPGITARISCWQAKQTSSPATSRYMTAVGLMALMNSEIHTIRLVDSDSVARDDEFMG
jgi:hypothetical protein